ncbi:flocculation protein FLO11-like isoform X1 [Xyrichtys novacula]|uniref:Flocculation protein FLO11-like isoform X1 n=1 Tax=Xyrichtys novacula TaxID=13765 RepID=A0AAV1EZ15_XYRNO|nr:flocculation protein FLO11-like isoform X1 [Xyrichtys novacula]
MPDVLLKELTPEVLECTAQTLGEQGASASDQAGRLTQKSKGTSQATKTAKKNAVKKKNNVPKSEGEVSTKSAQRYSHPRKPKEGVSTSKQAGRDTQKSKGPSQATKTDKTCDVVSRSLNTLQTSRNVIPLRRTKSDLEQKKPPWVPFFHGVKETCIGEKKQNVPKYGGGASTKPAQRYSHLYSEVLPEEVKFASYTDETDFARVDPTPTILRIQVSPFIAEESEESGAGGQPTKSPMDPDSVKTDSEDERLSSYKGVHETCIAEKKQNVPQSEEEASTKPVQSYAHPGKPKECASASESSEVLPEEVKFASYTDETDFARVDPTPTILRIQVSPHIAEESEESEAGGQPTKSPMDPDSVKTDSEDERLSSYKGVQETCIGEKKQNVPQSEKEASTEPAQRYAHPRKPEECASASESSEVLPEEVTFASNTDETDFARVDSTPTILRIQVSPFIAEESEESEAGGQPTKSSMDPDSVKKDSEDERQASTKPDQCLEEAKEAKPHEAAADVVIDLEHLDIAAIITRFFQSLSDEQCREVREGVFNIPGKEQLVKMCTDVLQYSADSVIRQSDFDRIFKQVFLDALGVDTQVTISPELGNASAAEVLQEVNTVPFQAPLAENLCDTSPASSKLSINETTLALAIATMRSTLTGRAMAIKMKTYKKSSEIDPEEDSTARDEHIPKKVTIELMRQMELKYSQWLGVSGPHLCAFGHETSATSGD